MDHDEAMDMINDIENVAGNMSTSEIDFLDSLRNLKGWLTTRQENKLCEIYCRVMDNQGGDDDN